MFALTYRINDFADPTDVGGAFDVDGLPNLIDMMDRVQKVLGKMK